MKLYVPSAAVTRCPYDTITGPVFRLHYHFYTNPLHTVCYNVPIVYYFIIILLLYPCITRLSTTAQRSAKTNYIYTHRQYCGRMVFFRLLSIKFRWSTTTVDVNNCVLGNARNPRNATVQCAQSPLCTLKNKKKKTRTGLVRYHSIGIIKKKNVQVTNTGWPTVAV